MNAAKAFVAVAAIVSTTSANPAELRKRTGQITSVEVRGNAFFAGDDRFYIRGIAYQPGGASDAKDPLADVEVCGRDIEKFKVLGVNTIRVYTIDNTADHDDCMEMLADAGIYLALDVNTPKYSIRRDLPEPSYNDVYLQSVFATVDAFAKYDNTLLFFSANEVVDKDETTAAAPFVKAVTRDIRNYIDARGHRKIPVGYSAADIDSNRWEMAQYMNCGPDDERSDFFAFNDYSWCDPSSFTKSGWDKKVEMFKDYGIPLFLSEFGCNTNERVFGEIESLYSPVMTPVYSGGLVYEYTQELTNYGVVEINGDEVSELEDFDRLKEAFEKTNSPTGDGGYNPKSKSSQCPPSSDSWLVPDNRLPAMPEPAKRFLEDGPGEGPGLAGAGSQDAGTPSSGTAEPGSDDGDGDDNEDKKNAAASVLPSVGLGLGSLLVVSISTLLWAGLV